MSELRARWEAMLDCLSTDERTRLLTRSEILHLPGDVPPWTRTGIRVTKGECVTWLAAGRIVISPELDLSGGPRFHLWARVGDRGRITNGPGDTFTLVARDEGPLDLAIYHGEWATPEGDLATPREAYASLRGALDVCLLHWREPGLEGARAGLARLAELVGDEPRLGQLFLNLLVNAAQAIPPGNAASNGIHVVTYREGTMVVVEIEDTGGGMSKTQLSRIFEPFFTTKAEGGTGLGLPICRTIVDEHGGELDVQSELGRGSRFTVRLRGAPDRP